MPNTVLVFRKRLLAYSETFIANQGKFLPNYTAWFAGFRKDCTGFHLLDPEHVLLQQDYALIPGLARLQLRVGGGINRRWSDALREKKTKLIHAHFGPDGVAAMPIADELSIPLVVTFHGFDITKVNPRPRYAKYRKALFDRVDKVIAVSNYIRDRLLATGCPSTKISVHRIGIDLEGFDIKKREAPHPTIVFIGRLVEKKGCTYLLQAAKLLSEKIPELEVIIAGDGPLRPELEKFSQERNLNVAFLGSQDVDQVKALISQAWVFSVPSIVADTGDSEGLSIVLLEAQALETPVVSFAAGGVLEAVDHGKTGLLAEEKNVAQLSEYLFTLLTDKALRQEYGKQGKQWMQERFDVRKQCRKLETIYDDMS